MFHRMKFISILLIISAVLAAKKSPDEELRDWYRKIAESNFDTILKTYSFIDDFSVKSPEREAYPEVFWKYPMRFQKVTFPFEYEFGDPGEYLPVVKGTSRLVEHINKGRVAYLNGDYEKARKIWLTARSQFRDTNPHAKRINYMIGLAYLKLAEKYSLMRGKSIDDDLSLQVEGYFGNSSAFLNHAFKDQRDIVDPEIDFLAARAMYNVAASNFRFGRFPGAYSAGMAALDYLRESGGKIFRHELHRIVAECLILNGSYDDAVRELDLSIRQDPDQENASKSLGRIGDVYYGLNNFESADHAYALAIALDKGSKKISANQALVRGDALFWIGQLEEAQKMLLYGLDGAKSSKSGMDPETVGWARVRFADTWLAKSSIAAESKKKEYLDKAKMEYFKIIGEYPGAEQSKVAQLRFNCIEISDYQGKSLEHSREFLNSLKQEFSLPPQGVELAWACLTSSFTERERTQEMLDRVSSFANRFPRSKFLSKMAKPVAEIKSKYLGELLESEDPARALVFYEANKNKLFKDKLPEQWQRGLFELYYDKIDLDKARPFWPSVLKTKPANPQDLIRRISWLEEITSGKKSSKDRKILEKYLNEAKKTKWDDQSRGVVNIYLTRIRSVDQDFSSADWIVHWLMDQKMELPKLCNQMIPLMSSAVLPAGNSVNQKNWLEMISKILDESKLELEKSDPSCLVSLFDLENTLLSRAKNQNEFAKRWLKRTDLTVNQRTAPFFWQASESLDQIGLTKEATSLWNYLAKSPADLEEVKWAKERLDPRKTQYEELWKE